ncbi:MAG: RNA polymerase sigma-70 factor [Flavitalea sp.]
MKDFLIYKDELLVELLANKDSKEAFEELYNRYWKKLLVHARFKIGSELEAEEIVQHVFMNIWKTRKNLRIKNTFYTYIFSCVRYEILASMVRQKKQSDISNFSFSSAIDNNTSEWLDYESTRMLFEASISKLPEKCQLVFRLSRENGFSEKEIAGKLGISSKTVQAHMTKALKVLKTTLRQFILSFF